MEEDYIMTEEMNLEDNEQHIMKVTVSLGKLRKLKINR